jgi:nicotinamide phosphoribosyltransferase
VRAKLHNLLLLTDSYKHSHWKQYPPGTTKVYSYFESRGGFAEETVFFGLQYFIKKYLTQGIWDFNIDEAKEIVNAHMGPDTFNDAGWRSIRRKHAGRLPVVIKAVPEGTVSKTHSVLMTVENTDPEFPWLTNFLETLLVQVWYPMTVATLSRELKKVLRKYRDLTSENPDIDFSLHDFGFRGVSSVESAGLGGCGHLVNFKGTDTMEALVVAKTFYNDSMAGYSIPAAEHSTITSWGKDGEADAYRNMLAQYPSGLVAVVSDSYDIYNACANIWGKDLAGDVLGRSGTLVVRPDSGYPPTVVRKVLETLWEKFGGHTNSKGFKVLDPHIRVIQGDGIDYASLPIILHEACFAAGFSTENLAFGSGGGLLQKVNRDTQKCAFKCSYVEVDGKGRDVYKEPSTDPEKNSKRGRFDDPSYGLQEVFRDGAMTRYQTLAQIRERAAL